MKIKKLLLATLCATALSACNPATSSSQQTQTEDLSGTYDITLWTSEVEGVSEQFLTQIDAFEAANPGIVFNVTPEKVTEADAGTKMLTDVDAGADLYCFAQDQFARLVQGNALSKLGKAAAKIVQDNNDAGAVGAVTAGKDIYAYPLTSDNGYFMYYDKTVVPESAVDSFEAIIKACEDAGKNFSFELENAYYTAGFFFGTGCNSVWSTNDKGEFTKVEDDFNSDKGFIAAKGMEKLLDSKAYVNSSSVGDSVDAAIPSAVIVSGTWDYNAAVKAFGENLGVADLPSFEYDGKSYHIGSFSGNKLLGVKPQADAKRGAVLHKLAQYLSNEDCQKARYEEFGWGPSNKAVAEMDCVKNNPALSALAQQSAYAKPQGQIHGSWWDLAKVIATDVKNAANDDEIKAALAKYDKGLDEIFTAKPVWGLVGSMANSDWKTNVDMTEQEDGTWTLTYTLAADDQFKFRINSDWDTALGASATTVATGLEANFDLTGDNIKCVVAGTYNFTVNPTAKTVSIAQ